MRAKPASRSMKAIARKRPTLTRIAMNTTPIALLALFSLLALSACNTVKGVGQDLQKAGEKIEEVAKKQ